MCIYIYIYEFWISFVPHFCSPVQKYLHAHAHSEKKNFAALVKKGVVRVRKLRNIANTRFFARSTRNILIIRKPRSHKHGILRLGMSVCLEGATIFDIRMWRIRRKREKAPKKPRYFIFFCPFFFFFLCTYISLLNAEWICIGITV